MQHTELLAKVLGPLLMFLAVTIVARRSHYITAFSEFPRQPMARFFMCMTELVAGLFLVVTHNHWSGPPAAVIITVFGWILVIEGAAYLWMSDAQVARTMRAINTPAWYWAGGTGAFAFGAYLAAFGYGWLA